MFLCFVMLFFQSIWTVIPSNSYIFIIIIFLIDAKKFQTQLLVSAILTDTLYFVFCHNLADLSLFPCLSCGGYDRVVTDIVMWFSSGGTKSVLHNDGVDNINCLFSGEKELYMVDPVRIFPFIVFVCLFISNKES